MSIWHPHELLGIPGGSSQTSQFFGFWIQLKTELIYYMKSCRWFDFWPFGEGGCFDIHFGGSPAAKFRCTSVLLHDKIRAFGGPEPEIHDKTRAFGGPEPQIHDKIRAFGGPEPQIHDKTRAFGGPEPQIHDKMRASGGPEPQIHNRTPPNTR